MHLHPGHRTRNARRRRAPQRASARTGEGLVAAPFSFSGRRVQRRPLRWRFCCWARRGLGRKAKRQRKRGASGGPSRPRPARAPSAAQPEENGAGEPQGSKQMKLGLQGASRLGFLFTRNRRRAVGSKSTDRIRLGQIWPRRGRSFPAQAQVAAWARGRSERVGRFA